MFLRVAWIDEGVLKEELIMGSFDVACSVSRITINPGDPVAYFPLKLSPYAYDLKAENNMLIYPWCYYEPVCLPIFGEYYDYGHIDSIQEDSSTKAIEKHFDRSIKEICGGGGELPCVGMFVHREIYQTMVDEQIDEWGSIKTDDKYSLCSREGFNKKIDDLKNASIKLRDAQKKGRDARKKGREELDILIAEHELDKAERYFSFREFKTFTNMYLPFIRRGWLKKQIVDFLFFNRSLGYANAHYFPAMNGYQCGNHYGNRIVHQKALEILNAKIKEREESDDS